MNAKIEEYLTSFKLAGPVEERIREIADVFKLLCRGEELDELFLSDVIDPTSGDREFASLWGFRGPYWMEARDFMNQSDVDISRYEGSIMYLGMKHEKLRIPGPANPDSRMRVEIETARVRYSLLSATGANCEDLLAIVENLLLRNLNPRRTEDPQDDRSHRAGGDPLA